MPVIRLTDLMVRTAKAAPGRQITFWDQGLPCFGLRVGERIKSWTVMIGEHRRRVTIGRYPTMSLQDARIEARRLILAATVVRHDAKVTVTPFKDALEKFVAVHLSGKRPSFSKNAERILRKHFAPSLNNLLMHEITRGHVTRVIDKLVKASGEANDAFAVIRIFLRWSVRRGYLAHNPIELMELPKRYAARDRVLRAAELKAVLSVAAEEDSAFGTIVLLLLLTGQRRGEIGGLRSEWIDRANGLLTLPREITKNRLEHVLPLTPYALSVLPTRDGLLFPARGHPDRAFNGWSKSMDALRKSCRVPDFRLHDLRRTAATMMASLGVAPHIVERILNHVTGSTAESITPLGRIYNRYRYLAEMREALLLWESEVLRLVAECDSGITRSDALVEPGKDLALHPGDAARPELDAFGEEARLLQAVYMCW